MERIENFGFVLNTLSRLYTKRFERLAHQLTLTLAQCKALKHLTRNQGVSQARLAEIADIEPMTLVRVLDRMELDGWVERRVAPDDRRARSLYVTAGAAPILERMDKITAQMREEALAGLGAEQCAQLMELLDQVHANVLASMDRSAGIDRP